MAISKIIYQDASEELLMAVAANGEAMTSLIEYDRGFQKAASSALVNKELLERFRPEDDSKAAIHLIAMGNSDQYGFNRNGDYFAGDVLDKRAHTFVTNGHVFREHRNKDPKKAIGQVKWAGYDPKGMQRVELIVHIDKDKAEEEYEMAKKGSALNFSMSCRVPNDRCSVCGNKAKSVGNYCDHLKYNMGRYMDGFDKYAFAYNDEPTFFDISRVNTPADRIARHLEYMFHEDGEMAKAASYGQSLIPSAYAAAAEGINFDMMDMDEMQMLYRLADAEEYANTFNKAAAYSDSRSYAHAFVYPNALMEKFSSTHLDIARRMNPDSFFRHMAKRACILSFPAFCQYITGIPEITNTPLYKVACCMLPKTFRVMRVKITKIIPVTSHFRMGSDFMGEHHHGNCRGDEVASLMNQAEEDFSVDNDRVRTRVIYRDSDEKKNKKSDDDSSDSEKKKIKDKDIEKAANVAECYAQYQIRALCDMQQLHGSNFVSDGLCDMIAGANTGFLN